MELKDDGLEEELIARAAPLYPLLAPPDAALDAGGAPAGLLLWWAACRAAVACRAASAFSLLTTAAVALASSLPTAIAAPLGTENGWPLASSADRCVADC